MRIAPLALLFGVAYGWSEYDRGLTAVERAYQESLESVPARDVVVDEVVYGGSRPYVVLENGSSTVERALIGGLYHVRGSVYEVEGDLGEYEVEVEGLPEGVKVMEWEVYESNKFDLTLSVDSGVEAGAYPYRLRGVRGDSEFELESLIPIEVVVDTIRVAAYNDFHGYIVQQRSGSQYSGALSMTMKLAELNNSLADRDLIVVGAGDSIGGSLYESAILNDKPTKTITRMWGTVAQALGNHEFDYGYKDILKAAAEEFQFPQLGANIIWKQKVDDGKEVGEVFMDATHIVEIKRGTGAAAATYKIGFVGVTLESLPSVVLAEGVAPLEFTDAVTAANKYGKQLKVEDGCDVVICLFHQGGLSSFSGADSFIDGNPGVEFSNFLQKINSEGKYIDVLATGHTHHLYNWNKESKKNPNLPPVVQTASFGKNLAQFDLLIERNTHSLKSVSVNSVRVDSVLQEKFYDYEANQWMQNVTGVVSALSQAEIDKLDPMVKEVNEVILAAVAQANQAGSKVTAQSTVTWPKPSGTETILGCHIADAMLAAAHENLDQSQIAMTNDGGIRKEWVPTATNAITVRHVYDTLPFNNELESMDLTGDQIKEILEYQWIDSGNVPRSRMFHLQTSGLRYEYNATAKLGERIVKDSLQVWNASTKEFVDIAPTQKYRVVTNNFLSGGGDNFITFKLGTNRRAMSYADNQYTIKYNEEMAKANNGHLVPAAVERAFNVEADLKPSVTFKSSIHSHGKHHHVNLTYATNDDKITVKGPFRLLWNINGKEDEFQTVITETPQFTAKEPMTIELEVDGCGSKGCAIQTTLMSEIFNNNPLPHGYTQDVTITKDGAIASIASFGLLGIVAFLFA